MKRAILFTVLLCFISGSLWAQEASHQKVQHLPGIQVLETPVPVAQEQQFMKRILNLPSSMEMVKMTEITDELGFVHDKYQQYFDGIIVEGGNYTLHTRDGMITHMSGDVAIVENLNVTPGISEEEALNQALGHVNALQYVWNTNQPNGVSRPVLPEGELVILNSPYTKDDINLTYKFDIYALQPLYRAWVYVDAHTGEVIFENSRIHHVNVAATGLSLYDGTVNFTADYTGSTYRLRQTADGNGIETYDLNNSTNYNNAVDFTSSSSSFTSSSTRTGVQAHYGAEQTHKYFLQKHNRNSFNGTGGVIRSYVSYSSNYVNAFWNGSVMTYGDGDGVNYGPLVSLDIVGHEITHGVTNFSANLVYSYESGALNESFSDIFGEAIENFAKGSNDWQMGTEMGIGGSGAIRSMDNPNAYGDPDTYGGTNWYTGSGDNGGVHINSGVQNKWFYILVAGESGTNDLGNSYSVSSIGMEAAARIAYRNLAVYLGTNSQYADARTYSIQSAQDLYGVGSAEEIAVTNAWYAVGVGGPWGPPQPDPCNSTVNNYPYSEGFENTIGAWSHSSDDDFNWTTNSGGTPSNGTGPSGASAGAYYVYMETSSPNYPSKVAILNSPCFDLTGLTDPEISFDYHMTGTAVGNLKLEASTDGLTYTTIWSQTGDQGTAWSSATVSLASYTSNSELRLRFHGTSGSGWSGDMCIDNLIVDGNSAPPPPPPSSCSNPVSSFPYSEGFEAGEGWNQGSGDDMDFTRRTGGTPSSGTGPSGAASGSYYMYMETSSPNYPTKDAFFESDCFDFSSLNDPEFTFDYHMTGTAVGTMRLQASTDGSTWSTVWSQTGDQGSSWNSVSVSLTSYAGQSEVYFRFFGTSGTGWSGDMCIDNLGIDEANTTPPPTSCPVIDFSSITINSYGGTQDNGSHQIMDAGATLMIENNAWKSISMNYTVTPNTVIEFDFGSTTQGEIHGIGFDNDNSISSDLTFKVHGTQNWGITNYDNYPNNSTWVSYTIPVGTFYTGSFDRFFFVCDKDASPTTSNSYFRNVKIYEGSCGSFQGFVGTQQNVTPVIANEGEWRFELYPNPAEGILNLGLPAVSEKVGVAITDMSGRTLWKASMKPGQQQIDISDLASGVYFVKVYVEGESAVVEKFVKM